MTDLSAADWRRLVTATRKAFESQHEFAFFHTTLAQNLEHPAAAAMTHADVCKHWFLRKNKLCSWQKHDETSKS